MESIRHPWFFDRGSLEAKGDLDLRRPGYDIKGALLSWIDEGWQTLMSFPTKDMKLDQMDYSCRFWDE